MNRIARVLLACSLAFFSGCKGDGPEIVEVSGTVTRGGKPVPNLMIYFAPTSGRPSWGQSDERGRFTLDYDLDYDGAKVDTHTVYVADAGMIDPTMPQMKGRGAKFPELSKILAKYGKVETSPLKVEITGPETNLELKLD